MANSASSAKLTYDDYLLFPEDGRRREIVAGEEYMSPSPREIHQATSHRLTLALGNFLERNPHLGRLYAAPFDVVLSDEDVVQPDLLLIAAERLSILTEANVRGAPDLIVEIVSEGYRQRDEVLKRKRYDRFGVAEYWVVDPELETIKVFHRAREGYNRPTELSREADDTLTTPLLPGFALPLASLFRRTRPSER